MRTALLLALAVVALPVRAQIDPVDLRGYVKNLTGWVGDPARAIASDRGNVQNTLQHRLEFRYYPGSGFSLETDLRALLIYQQNLNLAGAGSEELGQRGYLVDLSHVVAEGRDALFFVEIDRLFIDWYEQNLQATVGRQRIAWGTALVWNPTDIFNPYSVLNFDYEERPGTDAVRLQYFTGPTSKVELAAAPGTTSREHRAAVLYRFNVAEYDVSLMGGALEGGLFLGTSWAGRISTGGFRGEARWTADQEVVPVLPGEPATITYLTGSLSGDYTFQDGLYLHGEVLYNGDGVADSAGLRWPAAIDRIQLSPARWSLYGEIARDMTPLVRVSLYGIVNPLDGSFIVVPSVSWSAATNWDVLAIGLLPAGRELSEYGVFSAGGFLSVKWSF